jgi:hypothetical protein
MALSCWAALDKVTVALRGALVEVVLVVDVVVLVRAT